MAAPSRCWADFCPAISTAFLTALGRMVGSRTGTIFAPALSSASKIAATARSGSTATVLPESPPSASSNALRSCRRTPLPRCCATSASIFSGLTKRSAVPSECTSAKARATGVRDTSSPRTLNAQAMESSADKTAASAFCETSQSAISWRLSAEERPVYFSAWTLRCAFDASGRSAQTLSIGFCSTATSSAPRLASASRRPLHPVAAVQPRVVADAAALRCMLLQPIGGGGFRHRLVGPVLAVDLAADLQGVATVDEDRRLLRKDDGRAGRAFETGQPGQPLGVTPDIFAHMFVGERDDEAVELVGLELLAKGLQAVCIGGHAGYLILHGSRNKLPVASVLQRMVLTHFDD